MKNFLIVSMSLAFSALAACQSDKHTMVQPKDGTVIACKACYDKVYEFRQPSGSHWGSMDTQTYKHHQCPACKTETSIYTESGVTKIRCAKCAPAGVACDKCLPPKDWTPPNGSASAVK